MSGPRNPRMRPPAPPVIDSASCSLAEEIGDALNEARQMHTDLGLRPYRVMSVRQHWTGGEVGRGDVCEVLCREFLPRPKVEHRTRRELLGGGIVERGTVVLSEIDPLLTEDEVMDLVSPRKAEPGDETYIEIFVDARDGDTTRRRYQVAEPPERRPFEWRVTLRAQDGARSRAGVPSGSGRSR